MAVKKTFEFFFAPLLKKFFQDMGRDPNNLEMILLRQKAGQQLKDSSKIINFPQKRSFAQEIDDMKKSGDIVDVEDINISEKITNRDMFNNSFLNKPTIEGQMEKITGASNKIKQIQKEQADMYKPKSDAEIAAKYDKENKESIQRFKDKMKKDEPEDKADGGRIGFKFGKFVLDKIIAKLLSNPKKVKQAADDIFPTGDYKYDAQMAAEALVENNPKIFKNKLYDDLDTRTQIEIYGAVLEPIQKNMAIATQLKKASRPEKTLESMKKGEGIDMSNPDIADEFTRFMKETDPQGSKTIEQTVELANFDPKGRKKNATGGRAGFYTGGITDVEPSLDDIGHGSDSLMARTRLISPGSQTTTSTGLNYLLAEDNDNIRVPFAGGGDPRRRAFLKLMATLGGGIAGLKSGMIGLGEGTTKKAITETVKQSAGGTYPPPYFFKLVEKIKFMGDDVTEKAATQEREIVKRYKDYEMTEDIGTGNIVIKKRNEGSFYDQDGIISDEYIVYKPGQADELTKGKKPPPEYDEYTVKPDSDGKLKDSEDGLDSIDEILEEVGDTTAMTIKKADGGRIGYNIGGLSKLGITSSSRKFLEKVFGKEKFARMIENDPEMHRGMLEVVEMFRKKDKEGLKMYLQKFLPHMDDAEIENFIVGGEGTEGIAGQLIRLSSGRDYAGKLEMMQKLNNVKKLENLDVTDEMIRKPNSDGGRIGFFLGGGATYGKGLLRNMLNYMSKGSSSGKSGSEMLQMVNPKQFEKLLNDPSMYNKISLESGITAPELIKNMIKKTKNDRTGMIEELLSSARNIKKVDDDMIGYKNKIIEEMINKGIDREMAETFADMMSKKIMKEVGPKRATPEITEQGLLELENIQKNLITKDRKLQAQGGLTTMLGE